MKIKTVKLIYFSPTGTTRKVLEAITQGLDANNLQHIDLTSPESSKDSHELKQDQLALIGVPVYEGRVAGTALLRLQQITANNAPAIVVVVYGNRAFEDSLLELSEEVKKLGFLPIAGGAFIGEHSFANDERQMAQGRPDEKDLSIAMTFGEKIHNKLEDCQRVEEIAQIKTPGNTPYITRNRSEFDRVSASTIEDECTVCGECAPVCPTGAITIHDKVETDSLACILCNACLKICPTNARTIENPMIDKIVGMVFSKFKDRSEPELFM